MRIPAIDIVKGLAIIGVTLIHSEALGRSRWMTLLFLHSVPVFFVLFGTNSIQWFERHGGRGATRTWYLRFLRRILIPAWTAVAVWWLLVLVLRPGMPHVKLTPHLPFLHMIGYFKWVGISWFVTVLLELALLFPLLALITRRFGPGVLLALGIAITLPLDFGARTLRETISPEHWFVFGPRFLLQVSFGVLLLRWLPRIPRSAGFGALICLLVFVPLLEQISLVGLVEIAKTIGTTPLGVVQLQHIANRVYALPLTLFLLFVMQAIADGAQAGSKGLPRFVRLAATLVERTLRWLGTHSYGLYLGQMVTHNALIFWFGGACNFGGCSGPLYDDMSRPIHTAWLAAGSFAMLGAGHALLAAVDRLRARGLPLPDLRV